MKNFFSSKLNVVLTILLALVVAAGITLGILFFKTPTPVCADFSQMSESEIVTWAAENDAEDLIEIEYEYDESVPEGEVIYQSAKEGDKLTDKCTVYISKGVDPETTYNIVINENTTLDSLKEDLSNYGITNYTVVYDETSTLTEGSVISINPNPVSKADTVTITVAGKDPSAAEDEKEDDSDKVEISATGYLGYKEADFTAALKKLGFTNVVKDSTGVYCPKRDKDLVAAYSPDGKQATSTKITYYLSLGAYTTELAEKEFTGLTSAKAAELIKSEKFSTYSYTLETTKVQATDKTGDTLYDCTVSGTKIACKLAANGTSDTKATISELGYLGKTEEEFKTALTKLGFTNLVKDTNGVYSSRTKDTIGAYSPDGEQPIDATITYYLSLGPYTSELAKTDFVGKTSAEAKKLIESDQFALVGYKLSTTETTTTEYTNDTLYDCSVSGKNISCKLAKNSSGTTTSTGTSSTKATISEYGYLGYSETNFVAALNKLGFTNLVKDSDGVYSSRTAGTIGAYTPDGTLPIDTKINYYLSLGPYTSALAKADFEGKTSSEAATLIAKPKYSMLSYKLSTTKTATTSYTNDTLYDCSLSGKTISCKLANNSSGSTTSSSTTTSGTTAYINPTSYAGKTESQFVSALNNLGFKNLSKDANGVYSTKFASGTVAYYDPDGTQNTSTTINYWLSLGAFNSTQAANDFDGKTVAQANTLLATRKYSYSGISSTVSTTETETSSYTAGTLYGCTYSGSKVACKLAKAPSSTTSSTAYINTLDYIDQNYHGDSYSSAETNVKSYLSGQGFTNVTVTGVTSTVGVGRVVSVSVGGNVNYTAGSYAKDTAIVVQISNKQG